MAYNKTTKPGSQAETYGDYTRKSYQTYKPSNHESLYGIGNQHQFSTERHTEPIATKVKKLKGNIDHFERNHSSARPIQTTASSHKG